MKTMASLYETSAGVCRGRGQNCYLEKKLKKKLYDTPVNLKARKCGIIPWVQNYRRCHRSFIA